MNNDYLITELNRRVANIIRIGTVSEILLNDGLPRARITIGELLTDFLLIMTPRAGSSRQWWPLTVGEQVLVFSPGGDLEQGIILGSIFQERFSNPETSETKHSIHYDDDAILEYDQGEHHLKATLPSGATVEIIADGGVSILGDVTIEGNLNASGDVADGTRSMRGDRQIYNSHTHPGVQSGPGSTAPTSSRQ